MKFISSTILILTLILQQSFVYANDPVGWKVLKETIEKTKFSDVSKLQDRSFDLVITGATNEYKFTVEPAKAFKVDRLSPDKFRVTITNPEALVNRTDLIVVYYPIGWQLKKDEIIDPIIEGETTCISNVIFRQTGVGELNLADFDANYDVTYELSNQPSVLSVTRAGKGYDIKRVNNSSTESKIRLKIKRKSGDFNLQTDWILIPTCETAINIDTPPITSIPEPEQESNPTDILEVKIVGISFCEDASGQYCSTLQVTATNIGNRRVKCNTVWFYMKYADQVVASNSAWVDLLVGQSHSFQIVLKAPYKPENKWTYQIKKTDCFYK